MTSPSSALCSPGFSLTQDPDQLPGAQVFARVRANTEAAGGSRSSTPLNGRHRQSEGGGGLGLAPTRVSEMGEDLAFHHHGPVSSVFANAAANPHRGATLVTKRQ